jgi:DNA polymerase-3 subunit beta
MTTTATRPQSGLKIPRLDLLAAALSASRAVPNRTARPILQNLRIGDGLVTGTDLEVRIDRTIGETCEAFLVPCDRLVAILKAATGESVTLTPKGTSLTVKCGGGKWELPTEDVLEYPTWEPDNMQPVCRLPADQFVRAAKATVYATDSQTSRFALGGVLIEVKDGNPTWVATDGRRLAAVETETDQAVDNSQTIVPARVLAIVASLASLESAVEIDSNGKECRFELGDAIVTGRLVEGRFPRWRDVIGTVEGEPSVVEVAELLHAVEAAAIVASEQSLGVNLVWGSDTLVLSCRSAERGESTVKCPIVAAGTTSETKLDPQFVREFLKNVPADEEPQVEIWATDAQSRVLIKCGPYTGVIMPLAKD